MESEGVVDKGSRFMVFIPDLDVQHELAESNELVGEDKHIRLIADVQFQSLEEC